MVSRIVYQASAFALGEFHCPPEDRRWGRINVVEEPAVIAFPGTSVVIEPAGGTAVLANANHVMFYNGRQRYRRALHDSRGDHCVYVAIEPVLLGELTGGCGFRFQHGPSDPRAYLVVRLAYEQIRRGIVDRIRIDELIHDALARSVDRAWAFNGERPRARRERTERERHELVERTKTVLTESYAGDLSLADVARAVHTSEFHLARVFRERTGFTLHGYRTSLRLRVALDLLSSTSSLSEIAHEVGFSSHSHFTDAFRSVFGVPPSIVRAEATTGRIRELRRTAEAALGGRS